MDYKVICKTITGVGGRVLTNGNVYNESYFVQGTLEQLLAANLVVLDAPTPAEPTEQPKAKK